MADDQTPQPARAAEALEHLGRLTLRELSMDSLLQKVAELATTVLPGDPEASVTLLVKDNPTTMVHTGELALALDETQYDRGHGPCLHAARTGELIEIADTRTEPRWRDYTGRAAELGNLSSLSLPLVLDEGEKVGAALNIYARRPSAFDADARAAALKFAPYAAVAAGNLYAYQNARDMADQLQTALESRAVIDQAKGILIERYRITADEAFRLLAKASMGANRKLRDVADDLVHTGELPPPARSDGGRRAPRAARGRRGSGKPEHS